MTKQEMARVYAELKQDQALGALSPEEMQTLEFAFMAGFDNASPAFITSSQNTLQQAITLLMEHADGDFVSKADALKAGTELHKLMLELTTRGESDLGSYIRSLESGDFTGWAAGEINGYKTACQSIIAFITKTPNQFIPAAPAEESIVDDEIIGFAKWCEKNCAVFGTAKYKSKDFRYCWVNYDRIQNPSGYSTSELLELYRTESTTSAKQP